jgi:hypothetical protein
VKWFRRRRLQAAVDPEWDEIAARHRAAAEERTRRLVGQESTVAWLERLLFEHDPIGINFEENEDEYRPEAQTILLRRAEAVTMADLTRIIHEEFVAWFGKETAGPRSRYKAIARDVWAVWSEDE